jgi:hypothetical protein
VFFPIAPRHLVQALAQKIVVRGPVCAIVRLPEEAEEFLIGRQVLQGRKFQLGQGDVVGVQIDSNNLRGVGRKIVEYIAAARRDGQHTMVRLDCQRCQVDIGIFPDLVIDKSLKHKRKKPFERTTPRACGLLVGGLL